MAILSLYLDTRNKNAKAFPLKIRISHNYKQAFIPLGIMLEESQWENGKVVGHPRRTLLNSIILQKLADYDAIVTQLHNEMPFKNLTASDIKSLIEKRINHADDVECVMLSDVFNSFIENKIKDRTKELYISTWKSIEKFVIKGGATADLIRIDEIDCAWLESYEHFLETNGCKSPNARAIHLRNIRAVFNFAIKKDIVSANCYPFKNFKIRTEKTIKRSLSVADVIKLFNYTPANVYEEQALDVFKLSFFMIGINVVDMFSLKKNDLTDGRILYKRSKTGRIYNVKLEPEAQVIINKYINTSDSLLLNFCNEYANYHNWAAQVNSKLQVIAEKISLPSTITTYWARHSWATIAANNDIPKETISAALGHGGKDVTDIYINYDQKKVDDANRHVINIISNKGKSLSDLISTPDFGACPF